MCYHVTAYFNKKTGYTISQARPIGTIIAYFFGAILVYAVMLCLGELSVGHALHGFLPCLR
ncbi:hypothetical protein ACXO4K_07490 [Lactobacillus delbrueckii subsp. bulgaricus]